MTRTALNTLPVGTRVIVVAEGHPLAGLTGTIKVATCNREGFERNAFAMITLDTPIRRGRSTTKVYAVRKSSLLEATSN